MQRRHRTDRRLTRLTVVIGAVALLFAACGGGSDDVSETADTVSSTNEATTVDLINATIGTVEAPDGRVGAVFRRDARS